MALLTRIQKQPDCHRGGANLSQTPEMAFGQGSSDHVGPDRVATMAGDANRPGRCWVGVPFTDIGDIGGV